MKVEVEVTQAMVQDSLTRSVRKAISGWNFSSQVDDAVRKALDGELAPAIRAEVRRLLGDSDMIKQKAEKALNAAIKRAIK